MMITALGPAPLALRRTVSIFSAHPCCALIFYQIEIEFRSLIEKETTSENENGTNDIHRPGHPRV